MKILDKIKNLFGLGGITRKQIESLGFKEYRDKWSNPNNLEFRIEREKTMFVLTYNVEKSMFGCYIKSTVVKDSINVIFTAIRFTKLRDLKILLNRSVIFTEW